MGREIKKPGEERREARLTIDVRRIKRQRERGDRVEKIEEEKKASQPNDIQSYLHQ